MNKERAIEILKTIRHNSTMQTDYTIDNIDQALDIAIESLDNEQNIEQIKEKLLEKFKEHCYPVTQKDNSTEEGMTLTGIRQVLNEVFSNIESLEKDIKE